MCRGRAFTEADDEKAPKVSVINETMAKNFWPDQNPLGKRFSTKSAAGPFVEVVGVVPDGKYRGVVETSAPHFYIPFSHSHLPLPTFHLHTSVPPPTISLHTQPHLL